MRIYAGLDVSDKTTHICVIDGEGAVKRRDVVASDPDILAKWLKRHCPGLVRVVLETGPLSTFLYHGLVERAVPVICICARHAKINTMEQSIILRVADRDSYLPPRLPTRPPMIPIGYGGRVGRRGGRRKGSCQ